MPSLQDLLAQKAQLTDQMAALEHQISEVRRAERSDVIAKIRTLMAETGLTMSDIQAEAPSGGTRTTTKTPSKVAPKYRDPVSGKTWSGRGLKPRWLVDALAAGQSIETFSI